MGEGEWGGSLRAAMGKVHGSLARAGKVRGQTPKGDKEDKKKKPTGRASQRLKYNRRFVNVVVGPGAKRGPSPAPSPKRGAGFWRRNASYIVKVTIPHS